MDESIQKLKSKVAIHPSATGQSSLKSVTGLGLSRMKVRKQSYGFGAVSSVGGQPRRRSSQLGIEYKRPPLLYLNTYQLAPRVRFHATNVEKVVNSILDSLYEETKYSPAESPAQTLLIAGEVLRAVKNMNFNRYRIIAVVSVAQKRAQSYNNAVAFLWDHEFDSMVNVQREDNTQFIQVTVFGVYLD